MLASCYERSFALATEQGLMSIAFPAISTGIYGYPLVAATEIALKAARRHLASGHQPHQIVFCCFGETARSAYLDMAHDIGISLIDIPV